MLPFPTVFTLDQSCEGDVLITFTGLVHSASLRGGGACGTVRATAASSCGRCASLCAWWLCQWSWSGRPERHPAAPAPSLPPGQGSSAASASAQTHTDTHTHTRSLFELHTSPQWTWTEPRRKTQIKEDWILKLTDEISLPGGTRGPYVKTRWGQRVWDRVCWRNRERGAGENGKVNQVNVFSVLFFDDGLLLNVRYDDVPHRAVYEA